jgi:hypothetical protein
MTHGRVRRRQLGIVASSERLPRAAVRGFDLLSDQVVQVIEVELVLGLRRCAERSSATLRDTCASRVAAIPF